MARNFAKKRSLIAEVLRAVSSVGLIAGTALLLAKPDAGRNSGSRGTSGRTGRGSFTHRPSAKAIGEGFEVKDLSASGLAATVASLGIGAAILVGIVFGMIWLFGTWDAQRSADLTPEQVATLPPPAPRLQSDPIADLNRERSQEQQALHSYGWLDPAHARARIPIGRAMAIVNGSSLDQAP